MVLDVDVELCIKLGITAHQYIVLKLVFDENYSEANEYLHATDTWKTFNSDLKYLRKINLITTMPADGYYSAESITVSQEFIKLHSFSDDPFEEFYNTYPTKTIRPDGIIDYLRVDQQRSRLLYMNIIRMSKVKHDHMVKCLRSELKDRKSTGKMAFMKRMSKWLTSEEWRLYEHKISDLKNTQEVIPTKYGENVE